MVAKRLTSKSPMRAGVLKSSHPLESPLYYVDTPFKHPPPDVPDFNSHYFLFGLLFPMLLLSIGTFGSSSGSQGYISVVLFFLGFAVLFFPPTLFERPHPSLWKGVVGAGVLYCCLWMYILRLDLASAQRFFNTWDPDHSTGLLVLPQRSYAEDCSLSWANVSHQLGDIFVVAHVLGWVGKAFMFRDFWLSMTVSFTFELMEYTFEYLQVRSLGPFPNFPPFGCAVPPPLGGTLTLLTKSSAPPTL